MSDSAVALLLAPSDVHRPAGFRSPDVSRFCATGPGAQPGVSGLPGIPVTTYSYDAYGRATTVTQTVTDASGTKHTKTTTTTYDDGGWGDRPVSASLVTDSGSTLAAVGATTDTYDPNTGLQTGLSVAATATNAADSQTYAYDDFGRRTSYTAGDTPGGQPVTTSYDYAGRVATVTDARGSTTYGYNGGTERRGLATSETVSGISGAFTANYDADGNLYQEVMPTGGSNGYNRDEVGQVTSEEEASVIGGAVTTVFTNYQAYDDHGDVARAVNVTPGGQYVNDNTYSYDNAGRLTADTDTYGGGTGCLVRNYAYDADSNRLEADVHPGNADGSCNTSSTPSATTHTYDAADRIQPSGTATDSGMTYDTWGNITTLPTTDSQADTGDTGATTIGYYADNTVRSQSRALTAGGTRTITWTRDAAGRRLAETDGSTSTGNEYDGPSGDSPASTTVSGDTTRDILGLDGQLAATLDTGTNTPSWLYQDLHGDTLGTLVGNTLTAYGNGNDALGQPEDGQTRTYQYEGAHERSGSDEAGLILMGARLYDPALGRFLETDPVPGGSANNYDYANQDPVDNNNLNGQFCLGVCWHTIRRAGSRGLHGAVGWAAKHTVAACVSGTVAKGFGLTGSACVGISGGA